jgi:broad-specificity NMP kinase
MVFLAGPPGSGKSVLGRRVSAELGLRFVDLDDGGDADAALREIARAGGADLVTLPWALARDPGLLGFCRKSGVTVALWAHPLDMQARSSCSEPLFTPVKSQNGGIHTTGVS